MTNSFGATSTTDEVLRGIDLSGKRVLVTGVSAGLGVETARVLAAHGAEVIGASRSRSARRPGAGVRFTWANSTWPRSTVSVAAPTVCWPRASLST